MCPQTSGSHYGINTEEAQIEKLYLGLIEGWSQRDAQKFAAAFADDGTMISLDGAHRSGAQEIEEYLGQILRDPETIPIPSLVQVKRLRRLAGDVAQLEAIVGMIPPGQAEVDSGLHAFQVMTAVRRARRWVIVHLQSTAAQPNQYDDRRASLSQGLLAEKFINFN